MQEPILAALYEAKSEILKEQKTQNSRELALVLIRVEEAILYRTKDNTLKQLPHS